MNLLKALNWRYAVRKFSDEMIDESQVQELLTATRYSASSYGLQPYHLLVVNSVEIRQQLLPYSMGQEKVVKCSHLVIFAAQTDIGDETVNRYVDKASIVRRVPLENLQSMADHFKSALAVKTASQKQEWAHQQAYIALGNFLTCAALMEIDTCPMTGFEVAGYDEVLGLAEKGLTTSVICAIGKRHPDDSNASLQKIRFDHDEMILTV
ncbi:MAG: NAD(P)H-dependent oxidoreductase [Gammaproteobacteria bacterium]|nr:NAD(P)H-dependent oxidoreductase [Gammaproteobacteria bacterium]